MRSALRIAIATDERGWHTKRLARAFAARGCEARCVDLADCRIDTAAAWHGLAIPGFGRELPDAVFVRGIAGGSFEQVTLRLDILHALAELGVPVYNEARAIERSVDKGMTSWLLHRAGIATPHAWAGESVPRARQRLIREAAAGNALVLKPLFGSQGKGLQRLGAEDGGFAALPELDAYRDVAYLQRFVPPPGNERAAFDWRVLVIGGRAVAAMRRRSEGWVHNFAQGARCEAAEAQGALAELAVRAAAAIGLDYAGIDLIPDARRPEGASVLEVNGVAAWRGLQSVSSADIAVLLADDLLDRRMHRRDGAAVPIEA